MAGVAHTNFNSRLQPSQIGFGTSANNSSILQLDYGDGATNANNGNVLTQTITIGMTVMTRSYLHSAAVAVVGILKSLKRLRPL